MISLVIPAPYQVRGKLQQESILFEALNFLHRLPSLIKGLQIFLQQS